MSGTPDDCIHLAIADVRKIHIEVIASYGGLAGVRDEGLLESAIAAPQATAFGTSPFADLIEVAAAYLFYLCRNHPFHDGNKRVAMAASETAASAPRNGGAAGGLAALEERGLVGHYHVAG